MPTELHNAVLKEDGCALIEGKVAILNDDAVCQDKVNYLTFLVVNEFVVIKINVQFVKQNENKGAIWGIMSVISCLKMYTAASTPKSWLCTIELSVN